MAKKPLIGIGLDLEENGGEYSPYPFYALRKNYFDIITQFGGVPVAIPYDIENIERFTSLCDGLIIPGGNFDVPPEYYGATYNHEKNTLKNFRTEFEFKITRSFLQTGKPILGICGGMQLLNVVLGGTLIQDIATEVPNALEHEVKNREAIAHEITIDKKSKFYDIIGRKEIIGVNTAHHQAAGEVGEWVLASAKTSDGIIEVIEKEDHQFCIGVQYHPEYLVTEHDEKLIAAFIEACINFRQVDFWVI